MTIALQQILTCLGRPLARSLLALAMATAPIGAFAQQPESDDPLTSLDPFDPFAEETPSGPVESTPGITVTLRAIDKLRGDVETIEAEVGDVTRLWRLEIFVRACYRRTEDRAPESTAFLQVLDTKHVLPIEALASQTFPLSPLLSAASRSTDPEYVDPVVFSGWMFASSPALSAMDHPRYDLWVLSCNTS